MTALAALATTILVVSAGIGVVVWLRRRYVLVTVQGISMQPTYASGDRVLVRRVPLSAISRGAVVVVEPPNFESSLVGNPFGGSGPPSGSGGRDLRRKWRIKRAAAVPGEPVPSVIPAALHMISDAMVPSGSLVVLGDNTEGSIDSRNYGYVPEGHLLGIVVRTVSRGGRHRRTADQVLGNPGRIPSKE